MLDDYCQAFDEPTITNVETSKNSPKKIADVV
jgi:hypothetical protein